MKIIRNVLLFVSLISSLLAGAQSKEELQKQTQELLKEIESMKQSLAATQKDKKSQIAVLRGVERKINLRNQVIKNLKGEVYYVEKDIIRTYRDIDTLKRELSLLKEQYAESVVYAYKNRSNYNFINFLFSAKDFSDVLRRISYLKTYRNYREQKAGDILNTQAALEKKIASLTGKRKEKSDALDEQSKQMGELESERKDKDKVVAALKAKESQITKTMKNKEAERKKVQNAIAAVIRREKEAAKREAAAAAEAKRKAEELAKKNNPTSNSASDKPIPATTASNTKSAPAKPARETSVLESTPEGLITSQKFEENRGRLPWPVDRGVVVLKYGINYIPGKGTKDLEIPSDGISIEVNLGANVKAIFDGEVAAVSNLGDKQLIILKHGKYFSTYSNLQNVSVSRGQKVSAGQVIGHAGSNDEGIGTMDLQLDTEKGTINPESWLSGKHP